MMGGMNKKSGQTVKVTCVRVSGLGVNLAAKDAAGLPKRMKILNWGENPNARGIRVFVGDKLVKALCAPNYPWRKVALDFEHNTLPGTPAYAESKEPRDVAGFCAVECVPGDGVYAVMSEWTKVGLEKAQMYTDLSASPVMDKSGEVVAILSVALCKCGAVEGMDFAEATVPLSADGALFLNANTNPKDTSMDDWKKYLCDLLGLDPATATDDDIKAALAKLKGGNADGNAPAALSAMVADAMKPLTDKVTALEGALSQSRKDAIISAATAQGKVVGLSAPVIAKMTEAELQTHVDGIKATVPLNSVTPANVDDGVKDGAITETQRTVALNCGMDPEAVFGKKKEASA